MSEPTTAGAQGGETRERIVGGILDRYLDAYRDAIVADESAGPEYRDTDPDVDRAWERVNTLGTELRRRIGEAEDALAAVSSRGEPGDREWGEEWGEVAFDLAEDLVACQRALVLLASQLEQHSVPFVPDAEAATAKARHEVERYDRLVARGVEAATSVFEQKRAALSRPESDRAE